ncbi:MAG: o-succinylbenzoate--CoA ligase, partial [Ardenticatenaceae bacterium]|nr:o-succinylbenzoate--CoA ligase [Ardenticatenaceae bacterium]
MIDPQSPIDWLAARAAQTPDQLALIIGQRRWSYAELDRLTARLAGHLHDQGVKPGDFVAVLLPNSLEYVCLIHALARLGAVLVPLNTRLTEAEIAWQVEQVGAQWLAAEAEVGGISSKRLSVTCDAAENVSPSAINHDAPFNPDHLQAVVFTSGTSGRPKGAMLTFANHYASAQASAERLGVQADDLWLSVLPLYHVGGLAVVWRSCLVGTAVDLHARFDLDAINEALDTKPITLISLVPTMLHRLLQARQTWPDTLRLVLLGGAAAPPDLLQQAQAVHLPVATTYGLTEAASQVATMLPQAVTRKPGSVGKPLHGTTLDIVDEHGRSLPPHTIGEIVVSGPTVMAGYFISDFGLGISEEGLQNPKSEIRNLHTGDMGYLDEDGDLWVVQRRSDLIVSGGENVYPAEVEAVLRSHTAVANACVVGLPDPEWGQKVAALVEL